MLDRQVTLSIKGLQNGEEDSRVETVVDAEYFKRQGSHYLLYEERQEGFEEPVKSRIKLKEKALELIKRGPLSAHMVFEEGVKNRTRYHVPFGEILLEVDTDRVTLMEGEEELRAEVEYRLGMEGERLEDRYIEIRVRNRSL